MKLCNGFGLLGSEFLNQLQIIVNIVNKSQIVLDKNNEKP